MMWAAESRLRVWLCRQPTDLRKSFDGLSALVRQALEENPLGGELFAFVNRRKTQMRVLYFVGDGFCLWSKRLERGRFQVDFSGGKQALDYTAWKLIVEGIDLGTVRRLKRYRHHGWGSTTDRIASSITAHGRNSRTNEREGARR